MADEPAAKSDAPEKADGPEPFNPSGVVGTVERFLADQEAEASAKSAAKDQPAPSGTTAGEQKAGPAPPEKKPALRLVNEKGELVLDRFKSDGEEIFLEDPEAVKTWLGFGRHHNLKGEDLKRREEALQKEVESLAQGRPMFEQLMTALQEGRVKIVEPGGATSKKEDTKPGTGEVEEDDSLLDPATAKLTKDLRETRKELETTKATVKELKDGLSFREIEKVTTTIAGKVKAAKEKYKFADDDQVWTFLAETDEKTSKLKYTEEEAVKLSHESQVKKFQSWLEAEHPEFAKVSDSEKKTIIADYLETKQTKEEAPVGKPSGIPVGTAPKEKVITSLKDGVDQFFKDHGADLAAANKS